MTMGVRGERVALLSRSCSSLFCSPLKSVGGLRVCVPKYCTELKASGKRESFLKRSSSSRSTDSEDLSKKTRHGLKSDRNFKHETTGLQMTRLSHKRGHFKFLKEASYERNQRPHD